MEGTVWSVLGCESGDGRGRKVPVSTLGEDAPRCQVELGVWTRWTRLWARAHAYVNPPSWPLTLVELCCRVVRSSCGAGAEHVVWW